MYDTNGNLHYLIFVVSVESILKALIAKGVKVPVKKLNGITRAFQVRSSIFFKKSMPFMKLFFPKLISDKPGYINLILKTNINSNNGYHIVKLPS